MKRIGLAVLVLVLGLVACSSPNSMLREPQLEAQYGTADDDQGIDVATVSTGRIYNVSDFVGTSENPDTSWQDETTVVTLDRRDSTGKLIWSQEIENHYCFNDGDYGFYMCPRATAVAVATITQGNVYVLTKKVALVDYSESEVTFTISRLNGNGAWLSQFDLEAGDTSGTNTADIAVDGSGNVYVVQTRYLGYYSTDPSTYQYSVTKYSASGTRQWQRVSTVGQATDIFAAPSGNIYVAGTKGLAKYTSSGSLVWTKAIGPLENVVVSGPNIYTRYRKDIRKFDGNGKQLWLKTQSGLNTLIGQDISGDTNGNVYLSGKYNAGSGNYSPFVRKLNSSGTVLWTKTFGTPAYDDALGIATITGGEIYVTGETQGSLSHTNIGGRDGYLRKLNSSGNLVWSK